MNQTFLFEMYQRSVFPVLSLLTITWLFSFCKELVFIKKPSKLLLILCSCSLLLSLVVFQVAPVRFKILSDELEHLSVSRSLAFEKTPLLQIQSYWIDGKISPIEKIFENRPSGFPFLLALSHLIFGFSSKAPFLLNFLFLSLTFFLSFNFMKTFTPSMTMAASGVLFFAAQPVLAVYATSGGYDTASLFFQILTFFFLIRASKERTTSSFSLFLLTGIFYCHMRNENVLVFAVLISTALALRLISIQNLLTRRSFFSLLLLTPIALQILESREKKPAPFSMLLPKGVHYFSETVFFPHLKTFTETFFLGMNDSPFNSPVLLIALTLMGIHFKKFMNRISLTFAFPLLVQLILLLLHKRGEASHPNQARFFIPFIFPFCLLLPTLLFATVKILREKSIFAISVGVFLLSLTRTESFHFTDILLLQKDTFFSQNLLRHYEKERLALITYRPERFVAMGLAAIEFDWANQHADEILRDLKLKKIERILVFQREVKPGNLIEESSHLSEVFRLKKLDELDLLPIEKMVISEVAL